MPQIKVLVFSLCCFLIVIIGCNSGVCGGGYSEENILLSKSINSHLIEEGFCSSPRECHKKLDLYGAEGEQIHFLLYGQENRKMIAAFIEFSIDKGIAITGGKPISIRVFPKRRKEYGSFFFSPKDIINVEIKE